MTNIVEFSLQGCYLPDIYETYDFWFYAYDYMLELVDDMCDYSDNVQNDIIIIGDITRIFYFDDKNVITCDLQLPKIVTTIIANMDIDIALNMVNALYDKVQYMDDLEYKTLLLFIEDINNLSLAIEDIECFSIMTLSELVKYLFPCDDIDFLWYCIDNTLLINQLRKAGYTIYILNEETTNNPTIAFYMA